MRKAFTLIEILVTMGLVVILTGAGMGILRQSARRKAVEAATEDVAAVLHQAQTYAASGQKINCTPAQPLDGWQVKFAAGNYALEEACQTTNYLVKTVNYPISVTGTLPSPNPILFRVLGQGTNVAGQTGVEISGFGITKWVNVTSTGEVSLSSTPGAGPTPPASPTSCNLISRCSANSPGQWVSYASTNPGTCTTIPGAKCPAGCTVGTSSCVCQKAKSCCTTVLGAAGLDCASQSYVTIFNQEFKDKTIKLGDARGYKSLRVRFAKARSGSLGYCVGYYCTAYSNINFVNQTTVALPAFTNNSLVKINYECKDCTVTVILEGIVDPSYTGPTALPPSIIFSISGPFTMYNREAKSWTVDATITSALQLNFYWKSDPANNKRNDRTATVSYCAGSGCSNFTQLGKYPVGNAWNWSNQIVINVPVDDTLITVKFNADSDSYFIIKDISVTGRKWL